MKFQTTKTILFLIITAVMFFGAKSAFAADNPIILYTDIIAGPNSGGENNNGAYLSIFGKYFGDASGLGTSTKVYINNIEIADYKYLGLSKGRPDIQQLSVQVGSVSTGAIKVVTSNGSSNIDHIFTVSAGDIYFMSTSGSDITGNGSYANPYRTANKIHGISTFGAGDFLIVRGGTYDLSSGNENLYMNRWLSLTKSGSSLMSCVNIMGYPGEDPTIYWGTLTTNLARGIQAPLAESFATISNLIFDVSDDGGVALYLGFYSNITTYCNDCRIVNNIVKNGMKGKSACSTPDCYEGVNIICLQRVDRLKFFGNNVGDNNALLGCRSHAIYLSHSYDRAELAWNYIHDNLYGRATFQIAGDGWGDRLQSARNDNSYSTSCWGYNGDVKIHSNYFKNLPAEGLLLGLGSFDIYVYNNIFENMATKGTMNNPLALRGAEQNSGIYHVYNNSFYTDAYCNGTDGYSTASAGGIVGLGYMIGASSGVYPDYVYFYNNIVRPISSTTNYWALTRAMGAPGFDPATGMIAFRNLYFGSNQPVPNWDSEPLNSDPKFINPDSEDFRLQSSSPAINLGSSSVSAIVSKDFLGLTRPQGSGYDIGAFEYDENTPSDNIAPSAPGGLMVK